MVNPKNLKSCTLEMGFPKIESLGIIPVCFLPEKSKYADFFTFNPNLYYSIIVPGQFHKHPGVHKAEFNLAGVSGLSGPQDNIVVVNVLSHRELRG